MPEIYSYEPFVMEKINGKNIYEYDDLKSEDKKQILKDSCHVKTLTFIRQRTDRLLQYAAGIYDKDI